MEPVDLNVLLIDDDTEQNEILASTLREFDFPKCRMDRETSADNAMDRIQNVRYDLVVTDYDLNGNRGAEIFRAIKEYNPVLPVILLARKECIQDVVLAIKSGAWDFFVKPVKRDMLERTLLKLHEHVAMDREIERLKTMVHKDFSVDSIVGNSPAIRKAIENIGRSSRHDINVLVRGESGTGKELAAQAIHHAGPRRDRPFVVVNIAALSESLIESELFGHVKGAFTGADQDRAGLFEEADGGTLFIDEIGDISAAIQVKLLRVLQFGQFQRIGETKTRSADVRVVAATSRNLEEMMDHGQFRSDLYYRLNVLSITMPPLRTRRTDIPLLVDFFLDKAHEEKGLPRCRFSREAIDALMVHDFPGNIRELQNIVEHALVFCSGHQVTTRDLPPAIRVEDTKSTVLPTWTDGYEEAMRQFECNLLSEALEAMDWNRSETGRRLGIGERRLRYRMEKLEIEPPLTRRQE